MKTMRRNKWSEFLDILSYLFMSWVQVFSCRVGNDTTSIVPESCHIVRLGDASPIDFATTFNKIFGTNSGSKLPTNKEKFVEFFQKREYLIDMVTHEVLVKENRAINRPQRCKSLKWMVNLMDVALYFLRKFWEF